ncbi:MAG: DUF1330 domain-containing protein [Sphingomonas sp.]|nr:DUF1330 domain-containing protein [Sphingomonas sp.]
MPAYLVANYKITDADGYRAYTAVVGPTLAAHGAEILVADRATEVKEGAGEAVTVVIKFPSKEAAHAWYDSPEYREILPLRTENSEGMLVFADGFVAP